MIILSEGKFLSKVGDKLGKIGNKIVDKVDDYSTALIKPLGMAGSFAGGVMSFVPGLKEIGLGVATGSGLLAGLSPMLQSMRSGARELAIRKELRKREALAKVSDPKALEREAVRDVAQQSVNAERPSVKNRAKLRELRAKQGPITDPESAPSTPEKPAPVIPAKPDSVAQNSMATTNNVTNNAPSVNTAPTQNNGAGQSGDAVGTMISNTPSPVVPQKDIVAKPLQKKKVTPGPVTTTI